MLNKAGMETAKENNNVLIPLADLTSLNTRPTLKTLTTLSIVGDIGNFFKDSLRTIAEKK